MVLVAGQVIARMAVTVCCALEISWPVYAMAQPPVPETVAVPAGEFLAGSSRAEREQAYRIDERAYGHSRTREWRWYENELPPHEIALPHYRIAVNLVTNQDYLRFLRATGHRSPTVDEFTWKGYGLIHPYERTLKFQWQEGQIPAGRALHPVVLVSHADASAYADWLRSVTGQNWRLPTELEWEKAARGTDGRWYPWGNKFERNRLNSHDAGPFDTVPVGRYPAGASPYGLLDGAGQVFEWTTTPDGPGKAIVKGGSWDDSGCGVCRPAARHSRPRDLKHILIGFRVVLDGEGEDQ